jgi:hypothetical protein
MQKFKSEIKSLRNFNREAKEENNAFQNITNPLKEGARMEEQLLQKIINSLRQETYNKVTLIEFELCLGIEKLKLVASMDSDLKMSTL